MHRVLVIGPTPFFSDRGCHIRIYEEARWLKRLGLEVRVLTYYAGQDPLGIELVRSGRWVGYKKLEAGPSIRKPLADLSLLAGLRKEIKRYKPKILHCHLHEGAFIGLLGTIDEEIPVVLDYQGSLSGELSEHNRFFKALAILNAVRKVERWINSKVDKIFLNCESLRKELDKSIWEKSMVVGDGVDVQRFCPQEKNQELKARLGLRDGVPVIVYLGLLNEYQGVDLLIESFSKLKAKGKRFQGLIMGYPLGLYMEKAKRKELEQMVKFVGRVNYFEAERWLSLGDIGVAPKIARSESNGKILNYMAMGLATVCFDREVNKELAGECAEYVKYVEGDREGNVERLALGIERLMEDSIRRKELGEKGRERVERLFSWEGVAERILRGYQEIIR